MSLRTDVEQLRRQLGQLANEYDSDLVQRYALHFPPKDRLSLYRRLRVRVGRWLRQAGLRRARPPEPWLPVLSHAKYSDGATPFVIWALGADRETLRKACRGFQAARQVAPDRAPILITDVADFAFYSRLGWLVEYVPVLGERGGQFAERKQRYLAWRYRDLPVVPFSAGLEEEIQMWRGDD